MTPFLRTVLAAALLLSASVTSWAQAPAVEPPAFDPALAQRYGADARGMRGYVMVLLRTGPVKVPAGPERDAMFRGHFANMKRLSEAGILKVAGPLDGQLGRRGIFILAVPDVETARQHVATDPVIVQGEMEAEYHRFFSSAALMLIPELAPQVTKKPM